jgi:ATP-dependent DNA helicase RecG
MTVKLPPESSITEYKLELPKPEKLVAELIAFANGKGGRLFVGVDDTGAVVGIDPTSRIEELIANLVSDYSSPRIPYLVSLETFDGKTVVVVDVAAGSSTPYFLKQQGMVDGTYVRVGSTTRKASQNDLAELLRRGQGVFFDSEPAGNVSEISEKLFLEYADLRRKRFPSAPSVEFSTAALEDFGLCRDSSCTVAGGLLFSESPQAIPALQLAAIRAGRFRGSKKGLILDQAFFEGSLPQQLHDAVHFGLKNTRVSGEIVGISREDSYEYPEAILRELLTNALVHRDYSIAGSAIEFAIYDDRIEIVSPGGLAGQVTVANMVSRQYSRNPIIAKRMFEMGFFDSWGQGVDLVLAWAESSGAKVEFIEDDNQFTVIVYSPMNDTGVVVAEAVPEYRAHDQKKVVEYLKGNRTITNAVCRDLLGITKMQAQLLLAAMVKAGLLVRMGKGRSVCYRPMGTN